MVNHPIDIKVKILCAGVYHQEVQLSPQDLRRFFGIALNEVTTVDVLCPIVNLSESVKVKFSIDVEGLENFSDYGRKVLCQLQPESWQEALDMEETYDQLDAVLDLSTFVGY